MHGSSVLHLCTARLMLKGCSHLDMYGSLRDGTVDNGGSETLPTPLVTRLLSREC